MKTGMYFPMERKNLTHSRVQIHQKGLLMKTLISPKLHGVPNNLLLEADGLEDL